VHPAWARRGIGQLLFQHCRRAALAAGFRHLTLVAALPGEPFYTTLGFVAESRGAVALPDGLPLPFVHMSRAI
jgi:predicted N-acetyltransferase YhbS